MGMNRTAGNQFLDWQLKPTDLERDIVFKDVSFDESKKLQCCHGALEADITNVSEGDGQGRCLARCGEIYCAKLNIPVRIRDGILKFTMHDGKQFHIHKSVLVKDAIACAEAADYVGNYNDAVCGMDNPIIEIGLPNREHGPADIAETFPQLGILSFYKNEETGRVLACAIDEVTSRFPEKYRQTTLRQIVWHEFDHITESLSLSSTPVEWVGRKRRPHLIPLDDWRPIHRCVFP